MPVTVPPEFISPAYLLLASDLAKKKYQGRIVELHTICDFLPVLQDEVGGKDIEKKELTDIAEEKLKKDQYKVFKRNIELIDFMLKYQR